MAYMNKQLLQKGESGEGEGTNVCYMSNSKSFASLTLARKE
jgi:hypothetical protein